MVMEDNESCGSRVVESSPGSYRQERRKLEVYNEVLRRLKESNNQEAQEPGFDDELWAHFTRLPTRAEDVLMHKRLLQLAHEPSNRPAFEIRLVQVPPVSDGNVADSACSSSPRNEGAQRSRFVCQRSISFILLFIPSFLLSLFLNDYADIRTSIFFKYVSIHPPPAFGSSPNLEGLALEANKSQNGDSTVSHVKCSRPMHEITFSTDDKPKLLSQLTALLAEVGLNIQEAHAFSTVDGYSLDVFVVDGWPYEDTEQLQATLEKELLKIEKQSWPNHLSSPMVELEQTRIKHGSDHLTIPNDGTDVWEIDPQLVKFETKVASGSYGDLYKGTYCSQEVAIKVLKPERIDSDLQKEFAQEVFIMRKVRHKNVVQFIGACTKPPTFCIVTEFMFGGSVYDYLHKQKGTFKLPSLLRVALDISKGMNYLHQNNIIHRDLKAANLLMDENEVVKVADFGVARVKSQTGVMTAETGTYRWMAPEVIEHKPYDHKADVFSFGIVLWELLTGKGLRPTIPNNTHPKLAELLERCWQQEPNLRPDFCEIIDILQQIAKEVGDEGEDQRKEKSAGGFFSVLRRAHH
ncbi:hypothetical protein RHGRI_032946 [Rhododendron griersonianum]|uniref:non-specific serine/threonine protein kinase n=1 Tax=Rhododendron griersonianum TaxID=479676 RepID=A0AAV6IHQ4_9ERIC|nr:hypothetical protein RHGRI_032946 [Rhododendron griersonianum]